MEKFLNLTGLSYFYNRLKTLFATKTEVQDVADDLDTLDAKVDEIIAEGGEPNVIETVKVNNTALPVSNKSVNIDLSGYAETSDIPTDLSDLTNTGNDPYATESYVDQNGGKIDVIKVNGTAQTITNKEVDLTVPIKVSDLTNDSGFIDNTVNNLTNYYTKSQTYTQSEVDDLIAAIASLTIEVVQTLPSQDISTTTIYLVPKSTAGTQNVYDEYIYVNNAWELIGDTEVDLSGYWATSDLVAITTAEIDTIVNS